MIHEREKLWRAHILSAWFFCLMVAEKQIHLSIRASLIPPTSTLAPPLHPPTTTYICPVANRLVLTAPVTGAAGWGCRVPEAGGGISHPSMPSHRASRPCQTSLGETVKKFPFKGVYGAASNNQYQKPPAWNCPLATGRVSPVRRDQQETASIWGLCIQRQLSLLALCFC